MMNDTLFIFGGLGSNGQSLGDLWMLRGFANDSLHWVRLAQSGPTRHRHAAAIDPGVDPAVPHLIVQGGRNASLVSGEVWITPLPRQGGSTTVNWQSLSLSGGPGSREGHVAVLDPHVTRKPAPNHRRIFFHGGAGSFFTYDSLYILSRPDTGNTWTWRTAAQSNKPRSRWLHAAIYDSEWDYFRLFGGDTTRAGGKKNDLWTFTMGTPDDGTFTWRLEPQENPPEPRSGHAMTEDTKDLFVQKLERFEPSTGSTGAWSAIADPKQVRMYAMMYQLRNGDVFYAGNSQFESPPDDSSYVLDLPGGTWGNKTFSRFFGGSGMLLSRREVAKDTVLKCGGVGSESSDASTFVAHEKTAIASVDSSNGGTTWASSAFTGHAGAPPMAQPDHPAGWQGAHDRRHG